MPKKYTEEHINYVKELITKDKNPMKVTPATKKMCKEFGLKYTETTGRAFRAKMQKLGVTKNIKRIEDSSDFKKAAKRKFDKRKNTFIISWAQNNTPVHKPFFENLKAYAEELKANVHIIAGRYKNPTSVFTSGQKDNEFWVSDVKPYLDANRHNIHPLLQVLSDVKIQPTASTPLSGLNGVTGMESCVIGHPRVHLKSLPVLDGYPNKLLVTTGACTVENYTDSKAGKKGEFHHQLGFVIVELDGEYFHIRQVVADEDGTFYDIKYKVEGGLVEENLFGAEALILGDIHNMSTDMTALTVSEQMLAYFQPCHTMVHDLFDGYYINPHERKNPFSLIEKENFGQGLKYEISSMIEWLHTYKEYNIVVVRSNHDEFFDRFLMEDWRKQTNKLEYLKYATIMAEGKSPNGIIPYIIDKEFNGEVRALGIDEGYKVLEWELGVHGHIGASGSRGSATQFKNLNTKSVMGHCHYPHREDGYLSVGTLTKKRLGYNKGMSPWMHSNVVIYPNGKAQHLHIINNKFTNFKL